MEIEKVTIGQTLYEPRHPGGYYREHKVVGIGRKWIALDGNARCSVDGLMLDCGGYPSRRLYTSVKAHEEGSRIDAAWADLSRDLQRAKRPAGMTVEAINAIRLQLGLQVLREPA